MPEVSGVTGGGVTPQGRNQVTDQGGQLTPVNQAGAQVDGLPAPVGQPGVLGQPTGLPAAPLAPGQSILPDVLAGRDPSQLVAAEQMRARGGAAATEELLGLNRQPTIVGALGAPPGNGEALRHMTPTMRRAVMRGLLDKQREKMRRLAYALRREHDAEEGEGGEQSERDGGQRSYGRELSVVLAALDEAQLESARLELGNTARMLELLEELLAMQDYTISQMGTFSHG
jgi:hypothetical protein